MTSSNIPEARKLAACPECGAAGAPQYAPFCSSRCANVDLHRWLSEGYAIPAEEDDSEGGAETRDTE